MFYIPRRPGFRLPGEILVLVLAPVPALERIFQLGQVVHELECHELL